MFIQHSQVGIPPSNKIGCFHSFKVELYWGNQLRLFFSSTLSCRDGFSLGYSISAVNHVKDTTTLVGSFFSQRFFPWCQVAWCSACLFHIWLVSRLVARNIGGFMW